MNRFQYVSLAPIVFLFITCSKRVSADQLGIFPTDAILNILSPAFLPHFFNVFEKWFNSQQRKTLTPNSYCKVSLCPSERLKRFRVRGLVSCSPQWACKSCRSPPQSESMTSQCPHALIITQQDANWLSLVLMAVLMFWLMFGFPCSNLGSIHTRSSACYVWCFAFQ